MPISMNKDSGPIHISSSDRMSRRAFLVASAGVAAGGASVAVDVIRGMRQNPPAIEEVPEPTPETAPINLAPDGAYYSLLVDDEANSLMGETGVALIDKEMQNFAVFHPKTTIRVSKEGGDFTPEQFLYSGDALAKLEVDIPFVVLRSVLERVLAEAQEPTTLNGAKLKALGEFALFHQTVTDNDRALDIFNPAGNVELSEDAAAYVEAYKSCLYDPLSYFAAVGTTIYRNTRHLGPIINNIPDEAVQEFTNSVAAAQGTPTVVLHESSDKKVSRNTVIYERDLLRALITPYGIKDSTEADESIEESMHGFHQLTKELGIDEV